MLVSPAPADVLFRTWPATVKITVNYVFSRWKVGKFRYNITPTAQNMVRLIFSMIANQLKFIWNENRYQNHFTVCRQALNWKQVLLRIWTRWVIIPASSLSFCLFRYLTADFITDFTEIHLISCEILKSHEIQWFQDFRWISHEILKFSGFHVKSAGFHWNLYLRRLRLI